MFKKLSMLLAVVTLCTSMGIIAPVSAQDETEETVLMQSNFENCNLGSYTEENQMEGETDLRNGIVMVDDSDLSVGYTIKNGDSYESISEADIVEDEGTKVLRLNTFLNTYKMTDSLTEADANYPVVKSLDPIPDNSKIRIDIELKMSPRVSFYFHHSKPNHADWRIWRFENHDGARSKIKVLYNTDTGKFAQCNVYNTHTVIIDTATYYMQIFQNGELIWEGNGNAPAWNKELFFRQISNTGEAYKPVVTYNEEDETKIEEVVNPQYVYLKSLKVTTYTDIEFESATPDYDSKVVTPKEAVFNFSKDVLDVESATVTPLGGEAVDVKSSLIIKNKSVTVPYEFEPDVIYNVALNGVSDGVSSVDAETTFTSEDWKFSNFTKGPISTSESDESVYLVNEDFEASDNSNLISEENLSNGWYVDKSTKTEITELSDGTKALQLATGAEFIVKYDNSNLILDNTTTLSYNVYINDKAKFFNVDRGDGTTNYPVASWNNGVYKFGSDTAEMSKGEWHNVLITISDEATTLYVDGSKLLENAESTQIDATNFFRFKSFGDNVLVDDLKIYLNKKQTALTDIYPAYDATAVAVSGEIELTYSGEIGDVSGAKLIVKPNDTNEATVLTNGNGINVIAEGNKVKINFADALKENTGYALELSGLKNIAGSVVEPIKTRFSTVFDSDWATKDFKITLEGVSSKKYSVKVKNETNAEGARMVVAVYDENGYLIDVVFSEPAAEGNEWTELNATVNYKEGNTSKIFIWDSLKGMNLISGVISD